MSSPRWLKPASEVREFKSLSCRDCGCLIGRRGPRWMVAVNGLVPVCEGCWIDCQQRPDPATVEASFGLGVRRG